MQVKKKKNLINLLMKKKYTWAIPWHGLACSLVLRSPLILFYDNLWIQISYQNSLNEIVLFRNVLIQYLQELSQKEAEKTKQREDWKVVNMRGYNRVV